MAKKIEKTTISVEDKLKALYNLQIIDTEVDKIRIVRGELPLEIQDLEDTLAGLNLRLDTFNNELKNKRRVRSVELAAFINEVVILFGVYGLTQMNRQLMPDFGLELITIDVEWSGASAEDVEQVAPAQAAAPDGGAELEVEGVLFVE